MNKILPLIAFGCVAAGLAVGAGYYLAPSNKEIALMQMDDRDFKQSLNTFSDLYNAGDHSINVVSPLVKLNIHYGEIDSAIKILEDYLIDHPSSVDVRKHLVELYKSSQRLNQYCDMLEQLQKLEPSTEDLRSLADMYEFLGRSEDEMKALERLVKRDDYIALSADIITLATFQRLAQHPNDAIETIRHYIVDQDYKVGIETASFAVQLMLEQGKNDKAAELALRYVKETSDVRSALVLSSQLEDKDQLEAAYALLKPFTADLDKSEEVEQQLVSILLKQKKDDEVFGILQAQNDRGALPATLVPDLIDLAIARKNLNLMNSVLAKAKTFTLPEAVLLRYVSYAVQSRNEALARTLHNQLGQDYLRQAPLLNALLNVAMNDTPQTIAALQNVPGAYMSTTQSRMVVASLYEDHNMSREAFALLNLVSLPDMLNVLSATEIASYLLATEKGETGKGQLESLRASASSQEQALINRILFLLDAGQGRQEAVHQRTKEFGKKDADLLASGFDLAERYHHDDVASELAQRVYELVPNVQNRLQIIEIMLRTGHVDDVLPYLQFTAKMDAATRQLYLNVVADWIEKAGSGNSFDAQKPEVDKILDAVINLELAPEEKIRFAYLFENIGRFDEAEKIFISLADDQSLDSHDVSELLAFWQDHRSPVTQEWLGNRARSASGEEKVRWIKKLNEMGYASLVTVLVEADWKSSRALADQYIAALAGAHDKQKLNDVLKQSIDDETTTIRLRQLALVAAQEDVPEAAERGWRKLHQIDPQDSDASLQLGMAAYNDNHVQEAETLIAEYLQHNLGDYSVNYAYGDILKGKGLKAEAKPYFERSLKLLEGQKDLSKEQLVDEGHLLLYIGRTEQAVTLFRQLLDKYPLDKNMRADSVEALMEAGRYDEASGLLKK